MPVRTLDSLVPAGQEVVLLKVDAQGYDYHVLLGAAQLLAEKRIHRVVAEIFPMHTPGGAETVVLMVEFLNRMGYVCSRCNVPADNPRGRVRVADYANDLARPEKGVMLRGVNCERSQGSNPRVPPCSGRACGWHFPLAYPVAFSLAPLRRW